MNDQTTCDGCQAASEWYCLRCWNGLVKELHEATTQRDDARAEVERMREENAGMRDALDMRWSLAREVEAALGIPSLAASDEQLRIGVEAVRRLVRERDDAREKLRVYAVLGLIQQPNPDDDLLAVIRELWERGKHTPESAAAQIQALINARVSREARPKEDWKALRAEAERDDARADFDSLEDDAAKVVLAYRNGDKSELDEAVENLANNGRPQWWQKAKPIGLRGESDD